jgi:hypothetical protein
MASKRGNGFSPKSGFSFADELSFQQDGFGRVKAIESEFGGSIPDSIYTINVESSWNRWRRGFELATAEWGQTAFEIPFQYSIPLPPGVPQVGTNPPSLAGTFQGFPTKNKELGMHWAGAMAAGSLRFDNLDDGQGTLCSIAAVNNTDPDFWFVTLAGNWSTSNPLPPPLYVPGFGGQPALEPINGFVLEDRIITPGSTPITKDTFNPATNTRYGYMSAVLVDVDPFNGILTLKKAGSVQATPDGVLVTPSRTTPQVGRFFMTGTRYCCSCQDFNRRQYFYVSSLGKRKGEFFPRTSVAVLKPGRYEVMAMQESPHQIMNAAMTNAFTDRVMEVVAPSGYDLQLGTNQVSGLVSQDPRNTNRDFAGVFRSFGDQWTRGVPDPSIPGAKADGMPLYNDYKSADGTITSLTDFWTPLLDEKRYCKHIYAMKYLDNLFPPEPSDFPIGGTSMAEWEQELVRRTEKDQQQAFDNLTRYGLAYTDIPPFNCQSPMMMPMVQQLLNIPTDFIQMGGFTMFDKNGNAYVPASGEGPAT